MAAPFVDIATWVFSDLSDADKPILIDAQNPHRSISRTQARTLVRKLQGAFEPGNTVCLHLLNDIIYPVLFLAIVGSGCTWTGSNTAYTATELAHHFQLSETKYVVVAQEHLQVALEAAKTVGLDLDNIIIFSDITRDNARDSFFDEDPSRHRTLHDLLSREEMSWRTFSGEHMAKLTAAAMMSTSGTTGLPKMAVRTHHSMVCESLAIEDEEPKNYQVRRLFCTPIFHAFSSPFMLLNALRYGHVTYIMKRFEERSFAHNICDYGITETAMAPPVFSRLLNLPGDMIERLNGLRTVWSGGVPLSSTLRKRFLDVVPNARIVQVWGMTEGGWYSTFKYPEDDDTGSVGRVIPGYQARIEPFPGKAPSDYDHHGEILVLGPSLMLGYHNNVQATALSRTEHGWLRTGDAGYIKDGKIYIIDRQKELIKVNGWQVPPAELEAALALHDGIADAAVLGWSRGDYEIPVAFVVCTDETVTVEGVKQHMLLRLARYKVAACEVRFVHSIPRSATGKILKRELRKMLEM